MRFWIFFAFSVVLTSCVSHSTLFHGIDENTMNCDHISGNYSNDPDEYAAPLSYRLSAMDRKAKEAVIYENVDRIRIDYDQAESVQVKFFHQDSLVNDFHLSVIKRGNYLEIKRKLRLVPIPILFWFHDEKRAIIMNDSNGNLWLSHANFQAVFFLTMARSKNGHGAADYVKESE